MISRRLLTVALAALAVGSFGWQRQRSMSVDVPAASAAYTASDPGRIGAGELPQLVEFYHPG